MTWAFQFENQPWFAGFRSLATNGVAKPVLNVFRMFGMMEGQRVEVTGGTGYDAMTIVTGSVRERPDIHAFAARSDRSATVLVWNYHDDDVAAPASDVAVTLAGLPAGRVELRHYRIDRDHSNAYEVWKAMGSPQDPTAEQYRELERASDLALLEPDRTLEVSDGTAVVRIELPRQAVSLLRLSW